MKPFVLISLMLIGALTQGCTGKKIRHAHSIVFYKTLYENINAADVKTSDLKKYPHKVFNDKSTMELLEKATPAPSTTVWKGHFIAAVVTAENDTTFIEVSRYGALFNIDGNNYEIKDSIAANQWQTLVGDFLQ